MTFGSAASSSVQVGKVFPKARSLWANSPVTVGTAVSVRHSSRCTGTGLYTYYRVIVWLCGHVYYCPATAAAAYSWAELVDLE